MKRIMPNLFSKFYNFFFIIITILAIPLIAEENDSIEITLDIFNGRQNPRYFIYKKNDINTLKAEFKKYFSAIENHHPIDVNENLIKHDSLLHDFRWVPPRNVFAKCKKTIPGIPWAFSAYKGTLMISTDRNGPYLPPQSMTSYNRVKDAQLYFYDHDQHIKRLLIYMGLSQNTIPSDAIRLMVKWSPELFPDSLINIYNQVLVYRQIHNKKYSKTTHFSGNFFTLNGRLLHIPGYGYMNNSMSKKMLIIDGPQYRSISVRR